jgi:type IV secretion system protein VirD4
MPLCATRTKEAENHPSSRIDALMTQSLVRKEDGGRSVLGSDAADAITLGRYIRETDKEIAIGGKLRYGGPLHVLVFGPNSSGKSTRLMMPNLLELENRSIVVVDPKGELAAVTAPFRRTVGEVVIINPFGVLARRPGYEDLKSDGFNPLLHLDPDAPSFNSDAALLAEALVKVESKDPHWDGSAQSLIAAIIMYVCIEAKKSGFVPTLGDVRRLLCSAVEDDEDDDNDEKDRDVVPVAAGKKKKPRTDSKREKEKPKAPPPPWISILAAEMARSDVTGLKFKASQFTHWTNEISSIASSAKRQTEPFDDTEIAADLARGTFDFREMKKRRVTVYLILPPEMMDRHSKWLRLVLTSAFRGVLRVREAGEPKTLFMIDEFAALGHLQIIETVWALVRGYGIQIMPVLQDIHQLKTLYKERWETFAGMAGAVVAFGARDMTSAKWLSERAGDTTEVAASYNSGSDEQRQKRHEGLSWQQIKVPFITPQKFFALRDGFLFMWLARVADTIAVYAPRYTQVDKLKARARPNPYHQVDDDDVPGNPSPPGTSPDS